MEETLTPVEFTLTPLPPEPEPPSVYRTGPLVRMPLEVSVAAPADENLPPTDKVFSNAADRWKYEFPDYSRYATGSDVQFTKRRWLDPFNRNKLKGDYPVLGQRTFLTLTGKSETFADGRRLPTTSNLASNDPDAEDFFGRFGQFFLSQNISFSADLVHGEIGRAHV